MIDPINQQFNDLVLSHPQEAQETFAALLGDMESADCKFADKLIPTFLKPIFISREQARRIEDILFHVMSVLEKITRLYFSHPQLKDFFQVRTREAELMEVDPGYRRTVLISRPDSFFVDGTLRFVEFNCDSPAGAGYTDTEEYLMQGRFPFNLLAKRYAFASPRRMSGLAETLLSAYKEFAGPGACPRIAIVDWDNVRTVNEFRIIQAHLKKKGLEVVIADPRALRRRGNRLFYKDFEIDLIYRRVIFRELMEHYDEVQDMLTAYRDGAVCVVNPLRSRLASNKAILGIMTNLKEFREFFTDDERAVIQKHVPWTRRVMDIQTHYDDNPVFLRKHIKSHRTHLVLKPADSYGGKNVVIGCECGQSDWDALVERILSNSEDWVVQRYVPINQIEVPVMARDAFGLEVKKFNVNPFVFNGHYCGSVARFSDRSVINVSAGGGLVPVMEYSEEIS